MKVDGIDPKVRDPLLDALDRNDDGTVTSDEVKAGPKAPVDLDGDGTVSPPEQEAQQKALAAIAKDFRDHPDLRLRQDNRGGWSIRANPRAADTMAPRQVRGRSANATATRTYPTTVEADRAWEATRARLLDVNAWSELSPTGLTTTFELSTHDGKPKRGEPEVGDKIKIDIPGPDGGTDWVEVVAIEIRDDKISIQVRPTHAPGADPTKTDHFLDSGATNTFTIKREGDTVSAFAMGRNEVANTGDEAANLAVKARSAGVTAPGNTVPTPLGPVPGPQQIQWNAFTENLLGGAE